MKVFLILSFALLPTVMSSALRGSSNDTDLPTAELVIPEIVGGTNAGFNDYPYMVSLQTRSGYHVCGATLVAPDVILTAAHCLGASLFSAQIGIHTLANNQEQFRLGKRCRHPDYNDNNSSNDFVLFKLDRKVSTSNDVYPRIDDGSSQLRSGDSLTTIGFGAEAYEAESASSALQEIKIRYMTNTQCKATGYDPSWITESMLCAGAPNKDSCQGDSGGPLLKIGSNVDTLVGVTSWGIECANERYPGVYARVSTASNWIKSALCYLSDDKNSGSCSGDTSWRNFNASTMCR